MTSILARMRDNVDEYELVIRVKPVANEVAFISELEELLHKYKKDVEVVPVRLIDDDVEL